jgi:hypothetical protein
MYKVVQIWPGLIVCKQVTVCPGYIWTTLYVAVCVYSLDSLLRFFLVGDFSLSFLSFPVTLSFLLFSVSLLVLIYFLSVLFFRVHFHSLVLPVLSVASVPLRMRGSLWRTGKLSVQCQGLAGLYPQIAWVAVTAVKSGQAVGACSIQGSSGNPLATGCTPQAAGMQHIPATYVYMFSLSLKW